MIKNIRVLVGLLALIIHELSHLVCIYFLSAKGEGIEINGDLNGLEIEVHYKTNSNLIKNIISLAPIGGFLLWCLLISFTSGILLIILLIYTTIYVRVFLPSEIDIKMYNIKDINAIVDIPELY